MFAVWYNVESMSANSTISTGRRIDSSAIAVNIKSLCFEKVWPRKERGECSFWMNDWFRGYAEGYERSMRVSINFEAPFHNLQ